jgi:hypothetical protein
MDESEWGMRHIPHGDALPADEGVGQRASQQAEDAVTSGFQWINK